MKANQRVIAGLASFVCLVVPVAGGLVAACGGTTSSSVPTDGGSDGTAGEGGAGDDASRGSDGSADSGSRADTGAQFDSGASEGGPPCAPPSDPSKSALCLTLVPENIAFTSDTSFDGKGWLIVQVFDTPLPDLPDGGSVTPLATQELPPGVPDGGVFDLSMGIPTMRFDGLPGTVYARALFIDPPTLPASVGAGTWIAGFDLSSGIHDKLPLVAQTLPTGAGTDVSLDLVALRQMTVTLDRSVTPAGNGEGPTSVAATPDIAPTSVSPIFGIGSSPCGRVDGAHTAIVTGFVVGKGPYYVAAELDDFGLADGGTSFPPGSLASLALVDGGYELPAADLLSYPATAYQVSLTVTLNVVVPGATGTDTVTCP